MLCDVCDLEQLYIKWEVYGYKCIHISTFSIFRVIIPLMHAILAYRKMWNYGTPPELLEYCKLLLYSDSSDV